MSDAVHRYVVAYDVASDLRRTRIAKTLESFGDRLQYSVFLVDIKPATMVRLRGAVTARMVLAEDSLLICDLGPLAISGGHRVEFLGRRRPVTGDGPMVL